MELNNPRAFVKLWLEKKGIKVVGAGILKHHKSMDQLLDSMKLDYDELVTVHNSMTKDKIRPRSHTVIDMALREHITDVVHANRDKLAEELRHNSGPSQLADFISCLKGSPATEIDLAVMSQWLWLAKRKLNDLSVTYHIMPILYSSAQGKGKSEAVKRLTAPLSDFVLETTVADMADSRYYFKFQDGLIGVVNEMQGFARADVEGVKRLITADFLDVRRLGTNTISRINQNCSFIGTSNRSLSEVIVDTGMRRFYQIAVCDNVNYDTINSLDYAQIWKSIDEHCEGYVKNILPELIVTQQQYAHEDYHATFIADTNMRAGQQYSFVAIGDVYQKYCEWCVTTGNKALSRNWMAIKLRAQGEPTVPVLEGKRTNLYYKVNPESNFKITTPEGFEKVMGRNVRVL